MTEPVRLCRDCRWARNTCAELSRSYWYDWVCDHATSTRQPPPNYVTGEPGKPRQDLCNYVRDDPARCGIAGRYWEPRE
jgi:hypothetical protein